jgi:hypothetical protein
LWRAGATRRRPGHHDSREQDRYGG